MRILLVNDDGIFAKGIYHLAKAAAQLGEVWVVAPRTQCSAMSHQITFGRKFLIRQEDILEGIPAYSVDGTPADCVKIASTTSCRKSRMWCSPASMTATTPASTFSTPAPWPPPWKP